MPESLEQLKRFVVAAKAEHVTEYCQVPESLQGLCEPYRRVEMTFAAIERSYFLGFGRRAQVAVSVVGKADWQHEAAIIS